MMLSRRSLFAGAVALVAAPSIVRVSSLMPVSVPKIVLPPVPKVRTLFGVEYDVASGDGGLAYFTSYYLERLREHQKAHHDFAMALARV